MNCTPTFVPSKQKHLTRQERNNTIILEDMWHGDMT